MSKERLYQLRKMIAHYQKEYYCLDNPSISDYEYDSLYRELEKLEEEYPELYDANSPIHRIGGIVLESFEKVEHKQAMLSLNDVFSIEELKAWVLKIINTYGEIEFVVEHKIDGLAMSLNYQDGVFYKAATRGDGTIGEDVSNNVRTIKNIPMHIDKKGHYEIRGEIYMPKAVFKQLNIDREKEGLSLFANPRNAASGSIRQLDSKIAASRKLNGFWYHVIDDDTDTHIHSLENAKKLGFRVNENTVVFKDHEKMYEYILKMTEKRDSFDYEIDGLVIKVNDYALQKEIGYTSRTPKWAVAYKFPAEEVSTTIEDIFITVGRTGKCTPNAKLKKVQLAGTNVSYATLHNEDMIKDKDIRISDEVVVRKAGDIIPEVVRVLKEKRKPDAAIYIFPNKCPICNGELKRFELEANHYCLNIDCPAKICESIAHFASRDAMNIEGLGISTVKKFYEANILTSIEDIYELENKKDEILNLDRTGLKSYNNLVEAINNSKNNNLDKLIFGLGIRQVGEKASKVLASRFITMDKLLEASVQELMDIKDIGDVSANIIVDFFKNERNLEMINFLKNKALNMSYKGLEYKQSLFTDKTVVITGTLSNLNRKQAEELLEKQGAKISSSVSKKTDYLIYGESAGSKLDKAKQFNVKLLNEEEFMSIISKEREE